MKKITIITAIITFLVVVLVIVAYLFESFIINYLVNNNYLKLAYTIYSNTSVDKEISKENYIAINEKYSFDIENNKQDNITLENKYDMEILIRNKEESYKLITLEVSGYKSYLVAIYDASKVKLVSSKAFDKNNTGQQTVKQICSRYNGTVCVNGGGFVDYGSGSDIPTGIVIEDGNITWDDGGDLDIIGFNKENELVLTNSSAKEAIDAGIRDALSFGPFLIKDGKILVEEDTSIGGYLGAARVAIAQRKDGIVLFFVSDGIHGNGLSVYQVAEILKQYGAVNAGNLDGGASSSLVVNNKLINNPLNIYGQPVNYGNGRNVVTGFGLVE